jgi:cysteine synthase
VVVERPISIPEPYWANNSIIDNADNIFEPSAVAFKPFKFRGAYNKIAQMSEEDRARGVVAFSSGNHAQGVALAAKLIGTNATIVMLRIVSP